MIHLDNGDVWMLNDSRNPSILFRYDPVKGEVVEARNTSHSQSGLGRPDH